MTPTTIYHFTTKRDALPTDRELKEFQLERYQRMLQVPRDDKHKSYLRLEILQLKKNLKDE
jgi:hypothetical protein